uniref:Voltage-dependent T-type calcium channel subunit alpha n=1 Tax=Amphiprion ocellaris TaxID=80972 RepID=A0A3Q1CRK8_AMPOC
MDSGDRGLGAPDSEGRSSLPRTFIRLNDLSGLGTGGRERSGEEASASGGESLPYPEWAPVVFFYLKQTTRPRSWCLKMVSNPYPFIPRTSMLVILLNCVTLGMFHPCEDINCDSERCKILQDFDDFIFAFFAIEMVIKMVALGIFGKKCYLGDTWNRLDFFIVVAGMLEYSLNLQNVSFSAVRTVRVLRPLRAINRVPSMRILVNLLLDTLPMLGNVLLLCFFVFFIFGIVGVQLWSGLLRNRCFVEDNFSFPLSVELGKYYHTENDDESPFICSQPRENGMRDCGSVPKLYEERGMSRLQCNVDMYYYNSTDNTTCVNWNQYYTNCSAGPINPFKGAINFDNICYAWIAIFQVITLEGWVDIMYFVMDAHSFYSFIYFILLIIVSIGSFFMINLCLVVIATQFSETKQKVSQLMKEQRVRFMSNASTLASLSEPGSCYDELLKYLVHIIRKGAKQVAHVCRFLARRAGLNIAASPPATEPQRSQSQRRRRKSSRQGSVTVHHMVHHHHHHHHQHYHLGNGSVRGGRALIPTTGSGQLALAPPSSVTAATSDTNLATLYNPADSSSVCSVFNTEMLRCIPSPTNTGTTPGSLSLAPAPMLRAMKRNSVPFAAPGPKNYPTLQARALAESRRGSTLTNITSPSDLSRPTAAQLSCQLSVRDLSTTSSAMDTAALTLDPESCPYCAKALANELEGGTEGNETPGDSDSDGVYEFTQDLHHRDRRDSRQPRKKYRRLGKTAAKVVHFWRLVCDTFRKIVDSKYFGRGIMIAILINTLSMGIEYHEQPEELTSALEISNIVFTSLFALEMLLKVLVYGPFGYIKNPYNVFDGIIVVISVWEIAGEQDGGLSVLRTFRLMRVLKLVRFMPALQRQLVVLMKTMDNVATFCMLLMLFIFIFSILGMHLFGCKFGSESDGDTLPDRKNFDSLLWAIVTVFQILTQEDWNKVLYNGMASTSPVAALYFIALMTFGNYVLFNLLVAILVEGFQAETSARSSSPYAPWNSGSGWTSRRSSWNSLGRVPSHKRQKRQSGERRSLLSGEGGSSSDDGEGGGEGGDGLMEEDDASLARTDSMSQLSRWLGKKQPDWCRQRDSWSLYLFPPDSRFRILCNQIITHKMFDHVVLVIIFLNCITIAMERPHIDPGSAERIFLTLSNYIFTAIFVVEMTVKIVAMGWCFGDKAYLRSSWNVLDGMLVTISVIDILVSLISNSGTKILGMLRVLRLLRTLRPLRVISRAPGLKLVVETLMSSLKPIGNIVVICCAFFIIFGILGVQLFKGKFFFCKGKDVRNITNKSDCLQADYEWEKRKYNFDNLGQALMSLFVLASKDGWVDIMYDGLDAVGVDRQPIMNYNPWMLLYFISFLLIVAFFVLNMFVGVVVENFHKCRRHQEAEEAKRREEKRLKRMEKKRRSKEKDIFTSVNSSSSKAQSKPYYSDYSPTRLLIHKMCTSHYLDLFITIVIGLNVITMSMEHYQQPKELDEALKICNYIFTFIFVLESVFKLVAFGFRRFFKDKWNQLDLAIVLLSIMGITLEEIEVNASLPINPTIIRIMRVLRIARVLKLLKMAVGMRALLDTVMQALPQVGNLGLLFMLLFFIFAALGVELFGDIICDEVHQCEGLGRYATFRNFGMAFLLLFRVATGDNWNGIMKDTLRDCATGTTTCYNTVVSPIYFVSFVLTAQFVLVNVVIAVLMKHLEESNKEAKEEAELEAELELELQMDGGDMAARSPQLNPLALGLDSSFRCIFSSHFRLLCESRRALFDSVSLVIQGSMEGELSLMDNLSGSICHYYALPPQPSKHSTDKKIPLAEMEALSLASEKSWSLALTDDSAPDDFNPLFLTSLECNVLTVPLFLLLHPSSSSSPLHGSVRSQPEDFSQQLTVPTDLFRPISPHSHSDSESIPRQPPPRRAHTFSRTLRRQVTRLFQSFFPFQNHFLGASEDQEVSLITHGGLAGSDDIMAEDSGNSGNEGYSSYSGCQESRSPCLRQLKRFHSADTQGRAALLPRPRPYSWLDDPRRHSVEVCSSSQIPTQTSLPSPRRKKKMSPPCISVDPPDGLESGLYPGLGGLSSMGLGGLGLPPPLPSRDTCLRRRAPSSDSKDSFDLGVGEGSGQDGGSPNPNTNPKLLTLPSFSFEKTSSEH